MTRFVVYLLWEAVLGLTIGKRKLADLAYRIDPDGRRTL